MPKREAGGPSGRSTSPRNSVRQGKHICGGHCVIRQCRVEKIGTMGSSLSLGRWPRGSITFICYPGLTSWESRNDAQTRGRRTSVRSTSPRNSQWKKWGAPAFPRFFGGRLGILISHFTPPEVKFPVLSRKNRETRTGHPSLVRTFKYWRRPRTLSLRSVVPTLSQRSRKDGAPSIYFTNERWATRPTEVYTSAPEQ
jgi:hypothetical protein